MKQGRLGEIGGFMSRKNNLPTLIGVSALTLGVGILLTLLLSPRALIPVMALALIVAGSAFFWGCKR